MTVNIKAKEEEEVGGKDEAEGKDEEKEKAKAKARGKATTEAMPGTLLRAVGSLPGMWLLSEKQVFASNLSEDIASYQLANVR